MEVVIWIIIILQLMALLFIGVLLMKALWLSYKALIWDGFMKCFKSKKKSP